MYVNMFESYIQVAELASLAQLLPPCSPTVRNPVPNSSLCRAAAPRLRRLQLLLPARLPRSASISAELPSCIRFSCCSPLASTSAAALDCVRTPFQLLPDCIRFGCCSPIASASNLLPTMAFASSAAPRLRPFQLLLPDCVRFNCFPIASPSAARLLLPASCSGRFQPCPLFSNTLR